MVIIILKTSEVLNLTKMWLVQQTIGRFKRTHIKISWWWIIWAFGIDGQIERLGIRSILFLMEAPGWPTCMTRQSSKNSEGQITFSSLQTNWNYLQGKKLDKFFLLFVVYLCCSLSVKAGFGSLSKYKLNSDLNFILNQVLDPHGNDRDPHSIISGTWVSPSTSPSWSRATWWWWSGCRCGSTRPTPSGYSSPAVQ